MEHDSIIARSTDSPIPSSMTQQTIYT